MQAAGYRNYQTANISTADRGKLVIMVYDHCLKWLKLAQEHLNVNALEPFSKAIFKVQDGITELTCALDMEKGGEISVNLLNLYTFYNQHLTTALRNKQCKPLQEVAQMLNMLRESWIEAIEKVRREDRNTISDIPSNQLRMVG